MIMAILLVPLATVGGSPRKISMGSVSKEPPPARILITPAIKPTRTRKSSLANNVSMVCKSSRKSGENRKKKEVLKKRKMLLENEKAFYICAFVTQITRYNQRLV